MQTLEFTRALKEVMKELKVKELIALLAPLTVRTANPIDRDAKNQFSSLLFDSHAGYDRLSKNEATRKILQGLGAQEIYEPTRLGTLLTSLFAANTVQNIWHNADTFMPFSSFIALLRSFESIEHTCTDLLEKEKVGLVEPSDGILELELIEYADESGISPKRLEVFVASITELHTDLALIHEIPSDRLTFKYFDSGSGLLVGIQCAKAIADTMSSLLSQWFDRLRFWRYDTFEKKMGAISKGLAIVELAQQTVDKGAMTQDAAENLKLRVFREVDTLIGIGATIPLGEKATIDQRQLLTEMRNTKLLGSGESAEEKEGRKDDDDGAGRRLKVVD
jgi:hypothetical protein